MNVFKLVAGTRKPLTSSDNNLVLERPRRRQSAQVPLVWLLQTLSEPGGEDARSTGKTYRVLKVMDSF